MIRGSAVAPIMPMVNIKSGTYGYIQPGVATAVAQGVATLTLSPFWVPRSCTLSRVGAECTVIGDVGATMIIAIYNDDGSGAYPGGVMFDSSVSGSASTILGNGLIDLHNVSVQEITCAIPLAAGVIYWAGTVCQNAAHDTTAYTSAPTLRCYPPQPFSHSLSTTLPVGTAVGHLGFRQTLVGGALPGTFSTTISLPGSNPPRNLVKVL